jgi:hypothetical protein
MDPIQELHNLVAEHTIRYEMWPHYDIDKGKRIINGFDLELHGTHDHGHTRMTPGCEHCSNTYAHLRRIAEAILPKEERPSKYEIPPFDNSLSAGGGGEMEVVLTICIRHRNQYFTEVDACEEKCLQEMIGKLNELGVMRGGGARR